LRGAAREARVLLENPAGFPGAASVGLQLR
jgi:hypothetical protein